MIDDPFCRGQLTFSIQVLFVSSLCWTKARRDKLKQNLAFFLCSPCPLCRLSPCPLCRLFPCSYVFFVPQPLCPLFCSLAFVSCVPLVPLCPPCNIYLLFPCPLLPCPCVSCCLAICILCFVHLPLCPCVLCSCVFLYISHPHLTHLVLCSCQYL